MYPVTTGPPPARLPAASRVDKATSHLLQGPDWAVNLEICDTLNADRWQTKDVVKAVKKRLQHKDPKVQFFTLTLLETMMKNCGEHVHFEVVDQHVLQEMVKIIQKRRSGVMFPRRPVDAPPIFTPPATHQAYGSPRYPSGNLNERTASNVETLSFEGLNNIRNATELLCDMVNALNPADRMAVKDEIITELVNQCRSNQQKLMRFVSSTGKNKSVISGDEASSSAGDQALVAVDPELSEFSSSAASNALVPVDSTSVSGTRTKEQDMIDLLSLTLYSPPESSADSSTQSQSVTSNGPEVPPNYQPAAANGANYPTSNQAYPTNQGYAPYNNYVAPWAQTGPVAQPGANPIQPQQYVSNYPAPPWAMPPSANSTNPFQPATYQMSNPPNASVAPAATYPAPLKPYAAPPMQNVPTPNPKPMQSYNSFVSQPSNGPSMFLDARMNGSQRPKETPATAAKPYYMPDNLFGDLIDVKSFGAGSKINRSTSMPSPKGGGQPMIGRNK
ncbi:hypothetical protein BAE44_0015510 [Dichanthelium oligosanthes]|uniref:TOM1-like protein 2 n=1 Tax=Dichanthelium oligosanthes TaxID=888268 RepID=A0A1E5VE94_9POAL|nr:hypothetical protein BAE44_0015510 [Dichanthelium oligosanthes]